MTKPHLTAEDLMNEPALPWPTLTDAKPYTVGEVIPKKKPTHPWRCHVERGIDLHDKRRIPQSAMMGIKV